MFCTPRHYYAETKANFVIVLQWKILEFLIVWIFSQKLSPFLDQIFFLIIEEWSEDIFLCIDLQANYIFHWIFNTIYGMEKFMIE